jgi:hypothetical protein
MVSHLFSSVQLKVLRQLVEFQLVHSADVKGAIDRAWGVFHNKHKKKETPDVKTDPSDPKSRENLTFQPIGQDFNRKRFWVADREYILPFHLFSSSTTGQGDNLDSQYFPFITS